MANLMGKAQAGAEGALGRVGSISCFTYPERNGGPLCGWAAAGSQCKVPRAANGERDVGLPSPELILDFSGLKVGRGIHCS